MTISLVFCFTMVLVLAVCFGFLLVFYKKLKDQVTFLDKKEIIFIERNQNSTNIITKEETYKTSVSLGNLEEKLNPAEFMRCHKSYIINLSMISRIEPYGRWTYVVKLNGTPDTALMTAQNYEEIKKLFG